MLRPAISKEIEHIWGRPCIDLFSSRLNKQLPVYASWRPDPWTAYIDAFSINWDGHFFYAFPHLGPFSLPSENTNGRGRGYRSYTSLANAAVECEAASPTCGFFS